MKLNPIISGSSFGFLAVLLGALGAHALKGSLNPDQLNSYLTAVKFQMYHAIVLIVIGFAVKNNKSRSLNTAHWLFALGILLFSGSIYGLTMKNLYDLTFLSWLGPVTPLGGITLMTGWFFLILEGIKIAKAK